MHDIHDLSLDAEHGVGEHLEWLGGTTPDGELQGTLAENYSIPSRRTIGSPGYVNPVRLGLGQTSEESGLLSEAANNTLFPRKWHFSLLLPFCACSWGPRRMVQAGDERQLAWASPHPLHS